MADVDNFCPEPKGKISPNPKKTKGNISPNPKKEHFPRTEKGTFSQTQNKKDICFEKKKVEGVSSLSGRFGTSGVSRIVSGNSGVSEKVSGTFCVFSKQVPNVKNHKMFRIVL